MNRHGSLNRFYRLVWSQVFGTWIPVAETARARGKSGRSRTTAALSLLYAPVLLANPNGGQVVAGKGTLSQSGNTTTIQQSSQTLSLNWQSFNVAAQETVQFVQPSASAIAVNRIFDLSGSQIFGHLEANGQVYLINPNGIVFGPGAQVNVGGLVASTLELNEATLNGSSRSFAGNGTGSIVNEGTIAAATGGSVALLGNHVSNQGLISAQLGGVALGAGSGVTLTFRDNSLLQVKVDRSVLNSLAQNGGILRADGGQVLMTAGARDTVLASAVNNSGVIEARTVQSHEGRITLLGGMASGTVSVAGTLDASAPAGGDGGHIETDAAQVEVADGTKITTAAAHGLYGSWLIDPQDFTVAASGGDITGAALSTELNTTGVTLQSSSGRQSGSGNVNINEPVSWSANTPLNLTASNDVNINAAVTATGATAGLVISPNTGNGAETASGTGTFNLGTGATVNLPHVSPTSSTALVISGTPYTVINSLGLPGDNSATDLQGMGGNTSAHFALGSNLDATVTGTWQAGAGFTPIANFQGVFEGLGHTISNLTINLPTTDNVGLFGADATGGAAIRNVGLVGGSVTGQNQVGSLIGALNYGSVTHSYSTASVRGAEAVGGLVGSSGGSISDSHAGGSVSGTSGASNVGGLVGFMLYGSVNRSFATGAVSGDSAVGGLVGSLVGDNGTISNSHASGSVSATGSQVGGLVGQNAGGSILSSYATGNVGGLDEVGGLVGTIGRYSGLYSVGVVSNSYSTGSVSGRNSVGGLVGENDEGESIAEETIVNSYATGSVAGMNGVGGLVGSNGGVVMNSYSTGAVSGTGTGVGGLAGSNYGTPAGGGITGSFWNTTTSSQSTSAGGLGLTTAQLQTKANFVSATAANGNVNPQWDFAGTWVIYEGHTYPLLSSFLTPLTVTANNAAAVYSGHAFSGGNGVSYSVTPTANLLGTVSFSGTSQGALNTGSYAIAPGGLYSNQQGYLISYASGTLTLSQLASVAWVGGSSGTWSNAANWQGGALPDLSNVGKVTIPAGVTVTYDASLPGTTTLASFVSSGNLLMTGGTLASTGAFSTGGFQQSGGTLDVLGALSINSGQTRVTLGDLSTGSLSVISKDGAITQTAGTTVKVTGASSLTADNGVNGAGNVKYGIALDDTTNTFAGVISADGSNITLTDDAAHVTFGTVTASGNLLLNAEAGAITQAAGDALSVTGKTQLSADNGVHGAGDVKFGIALSNAGNDFVGTLGANGSNITLIDAAGGIVLGGSTATGNLLLISTAGAISQASGTALAVTGASQLTADNGVHGAGDAKYGITLAGAANDFKGKVTANGSMLTLDDATALTALVVTPGAAALTAGGRIDVSGTIGSTLTTVTTGGSGSTTTFGDTSVGTTLNVTSTGTVSLDAGDQLTVHGAGTSTSNPNVTVNGKKGALIK